MGRGLSLVMLVAFVAGCRSEAEERAELARSLARECVDGFAESRAAQSIKLPEGIDTDRICACAIRKSVEGKDVKQLRALVADGPGAEDLDARGECVVEEARRAGVVAR